MAVRSSIIYKTQDRVPGWDRDPFFSNEFWNDIFHEACDLFWESIVDAKLPFFKKSATITKNSSDLYPLPDDYYALLEVKDSDGNYFKVSSEDARELGKIGLELWNGNIRLKNVSALPATLDIEYRHLPKDMGDWDGDVDSTTGDTYSPDAPMNTPRAARILARVMVVRAKAKDEALTDTQIALQEQLISNYVDRMGDPDELEPMLIRTD